ncbi:MAG: hypothetical protein COA79_14075 [Planctomycetota bacterium]|nr:MAG: hypothetical protein COA79_14075 [Planctomycetota bacterium]
MLRILLAIICSIAVLGLMTTINQKRPEMERTIISYRLKTFEPKKLIEQEKKEDEILEENELEEHVEIIENEITIDSIIAPTVSIRFKSSINFSASSLTGLEISNGLNVATKSNLVVLQGGASIYSPKPKMPLRALQLGLSGKVKAKFRINKKGLVEDIEITESSHKIFNSSVVSALKKYRFSPFLDVNGQAIEKIRTREFEFNVK